MIKDKEYYLLRYDNVDIYEGVIYPERVGYYILYLCVNEHIPEQGIICDYPSNRRKAAKIAAFLVTL